jgi:NAD+--asparagine ADP-ribosyltransferase
MAGNVGIFRKSKVPVVDVERSDVVVLAEVAKGEGRPQSAVESKDLFEWWRRGACRRQQRQRATAAEKKRLRKQTQKGEGAQQIVSGGDGLPGKVT